MSSRSGRRWSATSRCVWSTTLASILTGLTELGLFAKKGEQSRTSPVPMKLILVDSHIALIPSMRSYGPGHELRASIVRHALLVEALQWLFEAVWDAAVPIMTSVNSETDPRRQMLISMLMTGSTDSAIANTLNINVRSVRRWISELMDELGVSTRLQLGAALVRSDGLRGDVPAPAKHDLFDDARRELSYPKPRPRSLAEPRASPRGRNSERNLGEKFHTGCAG